MKPDTQEWKDFSPVELAASEWLTRREDGLTKAEEAELSEWLAADPQHAAMFERMEAIWSKMDRMDELQSVAAPVRLRRSTRLLVGLAAAAAVLFAAGFGWREHVRSSLVELAAATEVGTWQTLDLPDGTTIKLNTDTAVSVHYTKTERRVRLDKGEAHFVVAKNKARPFYVEVWTVAFRAVGTAFNVRLHAESVDLLVTEGRVAVNQEQRAKGEGQREGNEPQISASPVSGPSSLAHHPLLIAAGERLMVALPSAAKKIEVPTVATVMAPSEIDQVLAWREKRLKFDKVPLATIVAEFNRYNRHQLVIDDASLAAERFGGTFRPDHPENLVGLLEQTFGVVAMEQDGKTVLRRSHR